MTFHDQIYRTDDGGRNYSLAHTKYRISYLYNCDPEGKRLLGIGRGGIYESTDLALTWHSISFDLPADPTGELSCLPNGRLYAATDNGIYRENQTLEPSEATENPQK